MEIKSGQRHTFDSKQFGKVTIENVADRQLNIKWQNGRIKNDGWLNLQTGQMSNVPQALIVEISNQ